MATATIGATLSELERLTIIREYIETVRNETISKTTLIGDRAVNDHNQGAVDILEGLCDDLDEAIEAHTANDTPIETVVRNDDPATLGVYALHVVYNWLDRQRQQIIDDHDPYTHAEYTEVDEAIQQGSIDAATIIRDNFGAMI